MISLVLSATRDSFLWHLPWRMPLKCTVKVCNTRDMPRVCKYPSNWKGALTCISPLSMKTLSPSSHCSCSSDNHWAFINPQLPCQGWYAFKASQEYLEAGSRSTKSWGVQPSTEIVLAITKSIYGTMELLSDVSLTPLWGDLTGRLNSTLMSLYIVFSIFIWIFKTSYFT